MEKLVMYSPPAMKPQILLRRFFAEHEQLARAAKADWQMRERRNLDKRRGGTLLAEELFADRPAGPGRQAPAARADHGVAHR